MIYRSIPAGRRHRNLDHATCQAPLRTSLFLRAANPRSYDERIFKRNADLQRLRASENAHCWVWPRVEVALVNMQNANRNDSAKPALSVCGNHHSPRSLPLSIDKIPHFHPASPYPNAAVVNNPGPMPGIALSSNAAPGGEFGLRSNLS
jgi:hypothetical protein